MFILARRFAGACVVPLLCLGLQNATAATRHVDPAGVDEENDCSAQENPCATIAHAISQSADGDEILLAVGEFTESNVVIDRSITIRGSGQTSTYVQAGTEHGWWADNYDVARVFYVDTLVHVAIHDVAVRFGCAREALGSGIYNRGNLTLTNTSVQNNGGYDCGGGGGIYSSGTLILDHSEVANNFAYLCCFEGSAGGIDNAGEMEISNSRIRSNHTDHYVDNAGIYNRSSATAAISDSEISENGSGSVSSGGIENAGSMTIVRSSIQQNYSSYGYSSSISNGGDLSIDQSVISDNFGYVSAVMNFGQLDIQNSTVSGNISEGEYGGVFNSGTLYSTNNTIVNNQSDVSIYEDEYFASDGAGGLSNSGVAHLANTILAGNYSRSGEQDCTTHIRSDAPLTSHGYNLIENVTGCEIEESEHAGTDVTGVDPSAEPLADNGGYGDTHALTAGSPAIDAIPVGANGCGTDLTEDQRGFSRPSGGGCDIGAFELQIEAVALLADLIDHVTGLEMHSDIKNALLSELLDAEQSYHQGSLSEALVRIDAFINQARSQRGNVLAAATADRLIADATYILTLIDAENGGDSTLHAGILDRNTTEAFRLESNYPNPFNATTRIHFHLPAASQVKLVVYDVVGREIGRPIDGPVGAGDHHVAWDAAGLPSGVYVYRLESGAFSETRQMTLLK